MRTPLRNCDECRFGEIRELDLRCAHNHKPPFVVPNWTAIQTGEWGWMRRCRDFNATTPPPPQTKKARALEQLKWREAGTKKPVPDGTG